MSIWMIESTHWDIDRYGLIELEEDYGYFTTPEAASAKAAELNKGAVADYNARGGSWVKGVGFTSWASAIFDFVEIEEASA